MITETLTTKERRKLRVYLDIRGTQAYMSRHTGIHRTTINRIVKKGHGTSDTISTIRLFLENH